MKSKHTEKRTVKGIKETHSSLPCLRVSIRHSHRLRSTSFPSYFPSAHHLAAASSSKPATDPRCRRSRPCTSHHRTFLRRRARKGCHYRSHPDLLLHRHLRNRTCRSKDCGVSGACLPSSCCPSPSPFPCPVRPCRRVRGWSKDRDHSFRGWRASCCRAYRRACLGTCCRGCPFPFPCLSMVG
jgi:hypothetical protein